MGKRTKPSGFTLVEMMIVVGIFSVIAMAVSMVYLSGTRAYKQGVIQAQMRMQCQRTITEITRDLVDCRIVDGVNLLDEINFQKPTARQDAFGDLAVINTSSNEPFWGDGETELFGSGEIHVGNVIRIAFVRAAVLQEAADNIDYNRDGDMVDTYERGQLQRTVLDAGGNVVEQRFLSGPWVFKPVLPHAVPPELTAMELAALDMDNIDGNQDDPDPIFMIIDDNGAPDAAGGRVQIRLFNMAVLQNGPELVNYEIVVTPVNKTE